CRQSGHSPVNQLPGGHQGNARVQREKLLRDYPLNATLWWLNWFDGRSESALAQWRGLCQGRDVNALMTAGQLIMQAKHFLIGWAGAKTLLA
ncbi:hypothetical protein ACUOFC_57815, partial [Escherichia sp. TWPC-MK]